MSRCKTIFFRIAQVLITLAICIWLALFSLCSQPGQKTGTVKDVCEVVLNILETSVVIVLLGIIIQSICVIYRLVGLCLRACDH